MSLCMEPNHGFNGSFCVMTKRESAEGQDKSPVDSQACSRQKAVRFQGMAMLFFVFYLEASSANIF